ncbi:MAG: O-methyltransferase [Parasporobacterium sp.]|nr:O-methyltransferase [Parasporobacterium sp.]
MIVNENLTSYIHSLEKDNSPELEAIRAEAVEDGVPIIRREMESFLSVLLMLKKPLRILEIGTGVAYSAIFMALNSKAEIITVENYEKRLIKAKENINSMGLKERINLIEADAVEKVREMAEASETFDMIFLDGPKAQYINMLPDLTALLPAGGILLADNVLQEGHISDSRFMTERRDRTVHQRMREFIWEVKHSEHFETSVITIGDGVTLSVKE